jgi:hypothetical protein
MEKHKTIEKIEWTNFKKEKIDTIIEEEWFLARIEDILKD